MMEMEFICEELFGEPAYRAGNGESYWHCPFHDDDHPSFHTLPVDDAHPKEMFFCFGCGVGHPDGGRPGDVADLLLAYYRREFDEGRAARVPPWPVRRAMLARLRERYRAACARNGQPSSSPRTAEHKHTEAETVAYWRGWCDRLAFDEARAAERERLNGMTDDEFQAELKAVVTRASRDVRRVSANGSAGSK